MRALVLGGTSFVGGRVVEHLRRAGSQVSVLNRGRSSAPPPGVQLLVADRGRPDQVRAALGDTDWDVVVDVSGFAKAAGGTAFAELVAGLDGRVGRYVYISSIMAYEPSGELPWAEDAPLRDAPISTYGGFKVYAERVLLEAHARTGFPATIGRPAAIYGPGNNIYDMEAAMFLRLSRGLPVLLPHEGLVTTSYGHVDDLCTGLLSMAEHPAAVGEAFNLTGSAVTTAHYVQVLAEIVGVEPEIVPLPPEAAADNGRPAYGHLFGARHHGVLDTQKAASVLGLAPARSFREGHEQTWRWWRSSPPAEAVTALADPLWGAGFDLEHEAEVAAACRVPAERVGSVPA